MKTTKQANRSAALRSTALLAGLGGLLVGIGYMFGGIGGATLMLVFALIFNLGMFFMSAKIAIKSSHAIPLDEEKHAKVYEITRQLAQRADIKMPKLYLIPTSQPNAFASGRNQSNAVVAITEGLLNDLSEDELSGVIAHELAHIKNNDILIQSVASAIGMTITWSVYLLIDFGEGLPALIGGILAIILAPIAASIIQMAVSRQREFAADAGGAAFTGNPESLASALLRIESSVGENPVHVNQSAESMYIIKPFRAGGFSKMFSTHPATEERVKRLREMRPSL